MVVDLSDGGTGFFGRRMMKRRLAALVVLGALIAAPGVQATMVKYIIGAGSSKPDSNGGVPTGNAAKKHDIKWTALDGEGSSKILTGTDLSKAVNIDGVDVFVMFDFKIENLSPNDGDFLTMHTGTADHRKWSLGSVVKDDGTAGGDWLGRGDSLEFTYSNIHLTLADGSAATDYVIDSMELYSLHTAMTAGSGAGTAPKNRVTVHYGGKTTNSLFNENTVLNYVGMHEALVDGQVGTINLGTTSGAVEKYYLSNLRADFDVIAIPEPCTLVLLGMGGVTLMSRRRRRKA